jgi:hypothetical protein
VADFECDASGIIHEACWTVVVETQTMKAFTSSLRATTLRASTKMRLHVGVVVVGQNFVQLQSLTYQTKRILGVGAVFGVPLIQPHIARGQLTKVVGVNGGSQSAQKFDLAMIGPIRQLQMQVQDLSAQVKDLKIQQELTKKLRWTPTSKGRYSRTNCR